jgi:glycosyltransferase involved in cell wall biosynthesis
MTLPLIVFSHLRWDAVYQRPQHLLSRIAHQHRVIFIEEPVCEQVSEPKFEFRNPCDNVLVARPVTPLPAQGFDDAQEPLLKALLRQLLDDEGVDGHLAWLLTPTALPLLDALDPQAVVYDCMDGLSAAHGGGVLRAHRREAALLRRADLVLTAGPSLFEAMRGRHHNVHCLPSGVDEAHYAPARVTAQWDEYLAAERLQGHILAPRIGFFGNIDERVDLVLLDTVARLRPDWHLVMVGPVARTDPAALPRRDNIHWLGQQNYSRLPALVAGWDVCMLPFALNAHTRYVSPAKTLEYLAAEKPVVSTPLPDVQALYGEVVSIAESARAFIDACERELHETPERRAERLACAAAMVARHSWDEAVRTVLRLMHEAMDDAPAAPGRWDRLLLPQPLAVGAAL